MNLQQLLQTKVQTESPATGGLVEISPDFRVAVQSDGDAGVHIIIHPNGHDGETLDFLVKGNDLKQL